MISVPHHPHHFLLMNDEFWSEIEEVPGEIFDDFTDEDLQEIFEDTYIPDSYYQSMAD